MSFPTRALLRTCAALLLTGALAAEAAAQDPNATFSYTYLDLVYQTEDVDGFDDDATAIAVDGAYALSDSIHLLASYADGEIEFLGAGISLDTLTVGVGYNSALGDRTDLYLRARYVDAEAEALGLSIGEDGFSVAAGLRFMAAERLELGAAVRHLDLGGSDTGLVAQAIYYATDQIGLGAGMAASDESTALSLGLRFQL
ncbi:MAG: outer membrane beta-barrel protein [Planctomycetota bacterium]|jgi:opacity protein-like surface antigen|nr:outer membrane beta-barrel protein [Planctomycetota bacterium]MDP6761620.1 outer membrane beta-barrel protein [Planctomycetota bacterium]MDP6987984.1 outer membrane beta-barrel protein [Planctomycetota bacterium]